MRLELHMIKIHDVRFGDKTRIDHGVLYISRRELQELLEADKRLGR
jgi:glycine reductase